MAIEKEMIERLRSQRRRIAVDSARTKVKEAVEQVLDEQLGLFMAQPEAAPVVPLLRRVEAAGHPAVGVAPAPSPAVAAPLPWADASPRVIAPMGLRMPEPLHRQLKYVVEHTPGASMHSIALGAVQKEVEARLRALGIEV